MCALHPCALTGTFQPSLRYRPPLSQELSATNKAKKLKGFEAIRGVHLESEQFRWACVCCTPAQEGLGPVSSPL